MDTQKRAGMQDDQKYRGIVFDWFLFDYLLPVFFIAIFWPIAAYFLKMSHPFDRVFHTADLIPLGAILMLASIREIATECELGRMKVTCKRRRSLALFVSFILLAI